MDCAGRSGRCSDTDNHLIATLVVVSGTVFFPILNNPTSDVLCLTLDTLCMFCFGLPVLGFVLQILAITPAVLQS